LAIGLEPSLDFLALFGVSLLLVFSESTTNYFQTSQPRNKKELEQSNSKPKPISLSQFFPSRMLTE